MPQQTIKKLRIAADDDEMQQWQPMNPSSISRAVVESKHCPTRVAQRARGKQVQRSPRFDAAPDKRLVANMAGRLETGFAPP